MSFSRHLIGSLAAAAILAPSLVKADAPAAKWYDKVSVSGYATSSYDLWLNQPAANSNFNGTIPGRAFDQTPNAFVYGGEMIFAYQDAASKTGANVDILYGTLNLIDGNTNYGNDNWNMVSIGQADVTQALGPITLTIGKFATPVGYESWNVTSDANFSRSIIYQQEPYYSIGAKVDYAAPAGITASLWLDNGNSTSFTNSDAKNWGVALAYAGVKNLTVNAQWYEDLANSYKNSGGGQGYFDTIDNIDVNVSYQVMDSLSLAGEYLYKTALDGSSDADRFNVFDKFSPKAQGYALYATYTTPVSNLSVAGRFESWFSPDQNSSTWGNTSVGMSEYQVDSYTLTVKYVMGPLSHILEYRSDASNGYDFQTNSTNNNNLSQTDQTVTYAAVYGF